MDKYTIKLEVLAEVEAFSEADAQEYISDIFNIDDEIKKVKIIKVSKNS
jgi:ribulose bisphosphate carboxylase small subunit